MVPTVPNYTTHCTLACAAATIRSCLWVVLNDVLSHAQVYTYAVDQSLFVHLRSRRRLEEQVASESMCAWPELTWLSLLLPSLIRDVDGVVFLSTRDVCVCCLGLAVCDTHISLLCFPLVLSAACGHAACGLLCVIRAVCCRNCVSIGVSSQEEDSFPQYGA